MNAPNLQYPMKQATSATFYPFDASTWQSEAHQTSLASPQATFSGTVWDVPSLELDSAVNMMPVLSYESSFEDSQTSLNASYPLEAGWIGSPAPFDGSRAQSEECEENARKEVSTPSRRSSVASLTLDVEETTSESTGAAGLSNEKGGADCLNGKRASRTARGPPAAQGRARDAAEPTHCSEDCRCMSYAL